MRSALFAVLPLALFSIAQPLALAQDVPPPLVAGKVTLDTGEPVDQAQVAWMGLDDKATTTVLTNAQGRYWMRPPKPGSCVFFAAKDDRASRYSKTQLSATENQSRQIDFVLDPGTTLGGQVTDRLGNPVAGVAVQLSYLLDPRRIEEGHVLMPAIRNPVHSDEKGNYKFTGVPYTRGGQFDYSYGLDESFEFGPGINFILLRKPILKAIVIDEQTKQPIPRFSVYYKEQLV